MESAEYTASRPDIFDLAYEAFVSDCLDVGVDPDSAEAWDLLIDPYGDDWFVADADIVAVEVDGETIEF